MASITVASNSIVLEVLNQHNYKEWSSRVETYLLAEDLWDVVNMKPPEREEREVEYEAWKTKNAKALHAIKISCGTQPFSFINETRTAKMAWEVLEKQFKSRDTLRLEQKEREERNRYLYTKIDDARQELTPADEEGGNQNSSNYHFDSSYEPFFDSVVNGHWDNAKECLATLLIPNVLRARNPAARGSTALHIAAREGHVHIVKELVLLMTQEDLEIRDDNGCTALHIAVQKENVDAVKEVVPLMRQQGLGIKNKNYGETALHVAAGSGNVHIAKELGELMREEDLEIGNSNNCHALHIALLKGHVHIGKELVALMRKEALEMNDGQGYTALGRAIRLCHQRGDEYSEGAVIEMIKPMVAKNQKMLGIVASPNDYIPVVEACMLLKFQVGRYLYSVTPREDLMPSKNRRQGASLFVFCLGAKEFDIPWDLLSNCPRLATVETVHGGNSPILVLSRMHSAFLSGMQLKFWQKWIYESINIQAPAILDIHDISIPISISEDDGGTQRDVVVSAVSLHKRLVKSLLDVLGNLSPFSQSNHIQGASLQMQRELQWFKEVKSIVPLAAHETRNTSDDLTARELFHKNHEKLMVEAEISMKGTATSCTVIGALIVTIMFAAAFTIPGGNNGTSGLPMFINENLFLVFIASDTISLIFSTTSVIIFLGILTSRYAEADFLQNLPTKMMIGLLTLFIAIATMMIAFSCGLVIMLNGKYSWVPIPGILVASIPVTSFAWMLFPLLVQTFISTYGPGIFNRKVKQWY
ncbi:ankyrin repeat-containing protein NPR4 isoform X4 [Rosa chinensis]|uniref:ankyrin repeat-containing protein NPR4 isoform X4 n=1 Tax=Rosa chinensis TaxID=74649 RepID=UPI000D08FA43|nr:ankyrin repeat-containing protein NPR4 isoform X4 [Rosa chinensis]